MNNTTSALVGGLVGLLIGIFIVPTFYVSPATSNRWGMMDGGQVITSAIDRHFIEEMIPHHEGAIAMAELALEKSKRPEILSLAEDIIRAQTEEINKMSAWYKDWFGTSVPEDSSGMMGMMHGGIGMRMMGMEGDLETLENAEDFDLEFIRQMIPHHEMAIMMARMLSAGTSRDEMKELADNIITSQSREIQMMQNWYSSWQ